MDRCKTEDTWLSVMESLIHYSTNISYKYKYEMAEELAGNAACGGRIFGDRGQQWRRN